MLLMKTHCDECGGSLSAIKHGVKTCSDCYMKHYDNPVTGVAGIYIQDKKLLLGKRSGSYKNGEWCIPCGYLENEPIEDGLRREFREETGLTPVDLRIYDAHTNFDNPKQLTVGVYYLIESVTDNPEGQLKANDDLSEVGMFSLAEMGSIGFAFYSDLQVITKLANDGLL